MVSKFEAVLEHYKEFFDGHEVDLFSWNDGPIERVVDGFRVFRAAPGPKIGLWVYASIGASTIEHEGGGSLEFVLMSSKESPRCVELLAMATYYHYSHRLGIGHTLALGEPWLDNSLCDHWLVSTPYPFGPELEICNFNDSHAHIAWLLPITESERNFKIEHGLEDLEQKFEDAELAFWQIAREAVV